MIFREHWLGMAMLIRNSSIFNMAELYLTPVRQGKYLMSERIVDCESSQKILVAMLTGGNESLLSLALDECIEIDDSVSTDHRVLVAIKHALGCPKCQQWRVVTLQPELFEWRKRAKKYCCTEMFRAIDAPQNELVFRFERTGPENLPYWTVGESHTVVHYCPWCGKVLPDRPFEQLSP